MKKWTAMFLSAILVVILAGCSGNETPSAATSPGVSIEGDNVLVAYFSVPETDGVDTVAGASRVVVNDEVLGNNQYLAQLIAQEAGGDLFRIETVQAYPGSHEPLLTFAYDERAEDARPALATQIDDPDRYDVIWATPIGIPTCPCRSTRFWRHMISAERQSFPLSCMEAAAFPAPSRP